MNNDIAFLHNWLSGIEPPRPEIELLEQGWGTLRVGENLQQKGPLNLGGKDYDNGLATHADSRIRVTGSEPLKTFRAVVGADHNKATLERSSVPRMVFALEADGREIFTSPPLTIDSEPLPVEVGLDGAKVLELTVRSLDGPALANADWCDPLLETVSGKIHEIGKIVPTLISNFMPLDFIYDDRNAQDFFERNKPVRRTEEHPDHTQVVFVAENAELRVILTVKLYKDMPVAEWFPVFENPSAQTSKKIRDIRSLSAGLYHKTTFMLHRQKGSFMGDTFFKDSFLPATDSLHPGREYRFGTTGGRPSVDWLPYFDLSDGASNLRVAIGWSGQWAAEVRDNGLFIRLDAGIEQVDTVLEPGERIELPSIAAVYNEAGGRERGINLWRRFILEKAAARIDGKVVTPPVCGIHWGGMTEEEHLQRIDNIARHEIPIECHWIDAGWYGPPGSYSPDEFDSTWSVNTGDWVFNPAILPDKLKNIAAASHAAGMRQLLWMEPERAVRNSRNYQLHPERYLAAPSNGRSTLLNLGDPDAWQYCFDAISNLIVENSLDWFRQDFNFSPLDAWRLNDAPDRRGITEIRYVAGLYKLWSSLRAKFPHLMIDNCASGGRRLDYRLMACSIPLWASDMECYPGFNPEWQLTHVAGLSEYLPLFSFGLQNQEGGDTYNFRASMGPGMVVHYFMYAYRKLDMPYPHEWLKIRLEEYKRARECFTGDYYRIAAFHAEDAGAWTVMQFDRPDLDKGIFTVFRGQDSPYASGDIKLRGLDPALDYLLEDADNTFAPVRAAGAGLMEKGFRLDLPEPRTARLIYYRVDS